MKDRYVVNIGLFGGTFNPVHYGHLKMAEAARKEYKLEVVYFIPCGIPPHKLKQDLLPGMTRYKLVKKAIAKKRCFEVLDIEIKKKKLCYTYDTVKKISTVGLGRDLDLYFLLGQDEFENLQTWKKPNELAQMVTFLVLPRCRMRSRPCRSGSCPSRPTTITPPKIQNLKWFLVHTKPINISSSEIRSIHNNLNQLHYRKPAD